MPRIFDIILALCGTVVLFIPCAIVAIILKKTGEGEIFYLQERIGRNRKPFKIYKFATMLKNSPNIGSGDITTGNDPRVLPIGKFLRKTKINELPQFINILNGSLRLVGPRPTTPKIFAMYPEEFKKVFDKISPGITGIGSVVFRDEESIIKNSSKDFMTCYQEDIIPYKARLEEWYVQNRSTLVDFKLIFLTAWAILFPRSDLHFKILPNLPRTADAPKPQKKILYVINHADWFWSHRLPLALAAKKSGWDVHVAVNGASDPKFKENGFTAHELSNTGIFIPLQIYRLIGKVQPEIMHAITLKYVFLAGIAALDHPNVKRVFTIAGLGYLFSGEGFKPKFLRALITPVLKIVLKGASIIVQNPDDRDILVESGLIKDCTLRTRQK
jgi:lipopolysaccharide/colanic/teichoic acid biosynthesis glycosyltransferase